MAINLEIVHQGIVQKFGVGKMFLKKDLTLTEALFI